LLYYFVLIHVLKTLDLGQPESEEELANLFPTHPYELIVGAKVCYEMILRIYYLRHGFEHLDPYPIAFVSDQGFMAIQGTGADEAEPDPLARRSTMALMAKCLHDQSRSMILGNVLFRLMRDSMPSEEASFVGQFAGLSIAWGSQDRSTLETHSEVAGKRDKCCG